VISLLASVVVGVLMAVPSAPADDAAIIKKQLPVYPMKTCAVSGEALEADAVNYVHEGRLVRFCCNGCVKEFQKDPKTTLAKVDRAIIARQAPQYPLDTCIVKGEALGEMPIEVVVANRLVRVCCKQCVRRVTTAPDRVLASLDTTDIKEQLPNYPIKECLVSGEPLGDKTLDIMYGNQLVRMCCKGCKKDFAEDPKPFLRKLHAAAKKTRGEHGGGEHGEGKKERKGEHGGAGEHGGRGGNG